MTDAAAERERKIEKARRMLQRLYDSASDPTDYWPDEIRKVLSAFPAQRVEGEKVLAKCVCGHDRNYHADLHCMGAITHQFGQTSCVCQVFRLAPAPPPASGTEKSWRCAYVYDYGEGNRSPCPYAKSQHNTDGIHEFFPFPPSPQPASGTEKCEGWPGCKYGPDSVVHEAPLDPKQEPAAECHPFTPPASQTEKGKP